MRIRKIHLTNFRNFSDVDVEFGEHRNLIVGSNAQGKTNLLESIHILGVGRSHRDRKDANLVRFGESFYRIEGLFEHIGVKTRIEVAYGEERKRIRINGKEARPVDLIGLVGIVISSPDDIELVKGSPGFRRTFLDMAISQMSKEYLVTLQRYVRALTQRNLLLKAAQERRIDVSEATTWTQSVVELGVTVVKRRVAYLEEIVSQVAENFAFISGKPGDIQLTYEARGYKAGGDSDIAAGLANALKAHSDLEIRRGYTLCGPHVDDFALLSDGRDIRQFGSEGEQRTAVLALRCAEANAMGERLGRYPLVLLDDVFAELDEARAGALTALISKFDQIVLTSSRPARLADDDMHRITITGGSIG
ncbi:MAG: DNA replication/repair protein RecF [Candidatus Eisenbacteria bacterium]